MLHGDLIEPAALPPWLTTTTMRLLVSTLFLLLLVALWWPRRSGWVRTRVFFTLVSGLLALVLLASVDAVQQFVVWILSAHGRLVLAAIVSIAAMLILFPAGRTVSGSRRLLAILLGVCGLCCMWSVIPAFESLTVHAAFWAVATLAIAASVASVTSLSPVYCAIWFAVSLLGVSGLLFVNGSQFLAVATVAVYAGAIVVTFLFVLMLAQPSGHSYYDRISWGRAPRFFATTTAVCLAAVLAASYAQVDEPILDMQARLTATLQQELSARFDGDGGPYVIRSLTLRTLRNGSHRVRVAIPGSPATRSKLLANPDWIQSTLKSVVGDGEVVEVDFHFEDVLTANHMAAFGGGLFGKHLIAVQAAGVLMLAALVGAVAIASRDSQLAVSPSASGEGKISR